MTGRTGRKRKKQPDDDKRSLEWKEERSAERARSIAAIGADTALFRYSRTPPFKYKRKDGPADQVYTSTKKRCERGSNRIQAARGRFSIEPRQSRASARGRCLFDRPNFQARLRDFFVRGAACVNERVPGAAAASISLEDHGSRVHFGRPIISSSRNDALSPLFPAQTFVITLARSIGNVFSGLHPGLISCILDPKLDPSLSISGSLEFKRNAAVETGDGRDVLTEGHHEFNFTFLLPSTGVTTSFEGKYGSIRYWLKAEVEKPWSFNHKTKKAFTVISPIDINRNEYLTAVESSVEKTLCCWCCTSGPISLYARTDRKGYCPGESIAITADFENLSGRTVVPHATLHQTQTFLAGGKSRSRHCKFTTVTGVALQPGRSANWDAQLLKIPAVSPSITNCCLIHVEYTVRITLQIPGAYNLFVDLPIVIGTVPLRSRPPHYRTLGLPSQPQIHFYPAAPPYSEADTDDALPVEPPPTYAECIEGSVDIGDDEDGEILGDTRFTPMYAYVHDYLYHPPPAYSEV
ncbi:hypothetical protein HPB50_021910 [Hyalomma asiaticum]|uniref:Uncharacterized protein n=1 Tax=Hyalomma asiaticum TaxID=266040 RepID=A0ACB7T4L9_HYAAI|nr:hypothetical protein HPB50_021910 [Hyalomma asiaticum]